MAILGSDQRFYNRAIDLANKRDYAAEAEKILGGGYVPPKSTSGTGVSRAPYIDPYAARLLTRGGGGGGGTFGGGGLPVPAQQGIDWDAIVGRISKPYESLQTSLGNLVNAERGNIQTGASRAATFLGEMEPMAAYRETIPAMQAPTAAASTYLGAIGADPAQIQALQNLQNQMMASQAAGQTAFGQAVDTSQNNYRLAQLADVYANQQRADAALGQQYGAQTAAIDMARIQQENALRQMLLEAQLQLIQTAASKNKGGTFGVRGGVDLASMLNSLGLF